MLNAHPKNAHGQQMLRSHRLPSMPKRAQCALHSLLHGSCSHFQSTQQCLSSPVGGTAWLFGCSAGLSCGVPSKLLIACSGPYTATGACTTMPTSSVPVAASPLEPRRRTMHNSTPSLLGETDQWQVKVVCRSCCMPCCNACLQALDNLSAESAECLNYLLQSICLHCAM